jgi:hypothetical protein
MVGNPSFTGLGKSCPLSEPLPLDHSLQIAGSHEGRRRGESRRHRGTCRGIDLLDWRRRRPTYGGSRTWWIRRSFARSGKTANIFGSQNVYVELQRHLDRSEEHRNQAAVRIARALKLPLVATNGVNYATAYEREVMDVLTSIRNHYTLDTAGRLLLTNAERYLRSPVKFEHRILAIPYQGGTVSTPVHLFSVTGQYASAPVLIYTGGVDTYKMGLHAIYATLAQRLGITLLGFDIADTGESTIPLSVNGAVSGEQSHSNCLHARQISPSSPTTQSSGSRPNVRSELPATAPVSSAKSWPASIASHPATTKAGITSGMPQPNGFPLKRMRNWLPVIA